ncbi:MAG: hypothetical protein ACAH09_13185 [Methylophilaceae bacterium]|nr:hypothetical protein [Methylophilaceae bacterium]
MTTNTAPTFYVGDGKISSPTVADPSYNYFYIPNPLGLEDDGQFYLLNLVYTGLKLTRYNSNGSLDTTFNGVGYSEFDFRSYATYKNSNYLLDEGKILFVGVSGSNLVFARYELDGDLDLSFGSNGKIITPNQGASVISFSSVLFQSDGKILVANGNNLTRYSSEGGVDTSFGEGGSITYDSYREWMLEADGKLLSISVKQGVLSVDRYEENGSLDSSFNGENLNFNNIFIDGIGIVGDFVELSDGKTLIAVSNYLIRYNGDGSLDTTFGNQGKLQFAFDFWGGHDVRDLQVQPDGKILVVGWQVYDQETLYDLPVARLNADGSLDTTFGGDGIITIDFSNADYIFSEQGISADLLPDGKILITGISKQGTGPGDHVTIARLNADGSIDVTFDATKDTSSYSTSYTEQQDDPIALTTAAVGYPYGNTNTVFVHDSDLASLNNGIGNYAGASITFIRHGGANAEDVFSAFKGLSLTLGLATYEAVVVGAVENGNGRLTITFNENATSELVNNVINAITYSNTSDTPDASIQIDWIFSDGNSGNQGTGGALTTSGATQISIQAINDAPTFAVGGVIKTDFFNFLDEGSSIVLQPDGKILVAGTSGNLSGTGDDFALVRYNSDGSLDNTFDIDGKVTTTLGNAYEGGKEIIMQADGKILVGGFTGLFNAGENDFAVVRYNSDGSLDTTFGNDGKVVTEFGALGGSGAGIAVQADGKILMTGYADVFFSGEDFGLARYNIDGTLDATFGNNGKVTTDFGTSMDRGSSILELANGKILVGGYATNASGNTDFALAQYNSDGTLDSSFDGDGKVVTDFGSSFDKSYSVVQQSDGKILLAGSINNDDFAIARYNSDGSLDTSFDQDGLLTTDFFSWSDLSYDITLQADGKILVTGAASTGLEHVIALVRYNTDGSLDSSFGGDGKVVTDVGTYYGAGRSVTVQSDGKILVGGGDGYDFVVARYNPDGTLDNDFGVANTLNNVVGYIEGNPAVVMDSTIQIYDTELAVQGHYGGSSVVLARHGGANAQDVFSGSGNLIFSGGHAILSGVNIGDIVVNGGGTLSIKFNENATQVRINEALSSIAYSNSSDTPPASVQIDWSFKDGNVSTQGAGGEKSALGSVIVNITSLISGTDGDDVLQGSVGADSMDGGRGSDTYIVNHTGDSVAEGYTAAEAGGNDTVQSSVSFTLSSNLDNLTLTGTGNIDGVGNSLDNLLLGNSGSNMLSGGDGADVLNGAAGNDTLLGGLGNDTYVIDSLGDTVTENAEEGSDLVRINIATSGGSYTLSNHIENGTLTNSVGYTLTGNALNNTLTGNAANNTLDGGTGIDSLAGGAGDDSYLVDLTAAGALQDTVSEAAGAGSDTVTLRGSSINGAATIITLDANVEALDASGTGTSLLNLLGNSGNNTLIGNAANNVLNGVAGADTLLGGLGNDTYVIDTLGDTVTENADEGTDLIRINIATAGGSYSLGSHIENGTLTNAVAYNLTGNALNNTLTGNAADNTLDGGTGADSLNGGKGNDTYVVDNAGDTVTESYSAAEDGGMDLVQSGVSFTLGANLDNLTLTGIGNIDATGNGLNNTLTGNAANNTLDGGAGVDTLVGGAGDDSYIVDLTAAGALQDSVSEGLNAGTDTLTLRGSSTNGMATIITLDANLETLDASATGTSLLNLLGNGLNNTITGNAVNNVLNGGAGIDTLAGGLGNDIYVLDNASDSVTENADEGADLVRVNIAAAGGSYTLGSHIENGTLINTVAYNLTGNALNNTLTGNAADNTLDGGDGNDTLSGVSGNDSLVGGLGNDSLSGGVGNDELAGGGGNDTYVFDATLISSNHDTVQDFLTADDIFHLDNDIFTALNLGTLSSDAFHIGTAATDADTRILYNSTTGALSYDSDGTGSQTAVQFATITTANLVGTLTATNFVIVD